MLKALNKFREPLALVILNVSRDEVLREARAKALHDAGYYTSSAETPEEAIALSGQMKCAVAIVCHSFTAFEHTLIQIGIQKYAPSTTVIFLGKSEDQNPRVLLSMVKAALASRESGDHGYLLN